MPHRPTALSVLVALLLLLLSGCGPHPPAGSTPRIIERFDQVSGTTELLIALSPVDDRVVWVSGAGGTWARTTDGGAHWASHRVPRADSLQFRDVHAVDAERAYLLSIGSGDRSRIYKTVDSGNTWTLQFANADPKAFYDCFDFWDADHGIAIGDAVDGEIVIITTTDGGAHWTRIAPAALPAALPAEGSFAASGTCLVTRPGGRAWIVMSNRDHARLLRTADYGRRWMIDSLPVTTRDGVGPQSVSFRDDRHGIVIGGGANAKPTDIGSAVTRDGGATWTAAGRPALATGVWGAAYVPGARAPTVVAVGPDGAAYSRDDGVSWIPIDSLNYWSVGFASPNAGWAVGKGGRITRIGGF